MIFIQLQPEPSSFEIKVRRPGHEFLKKNPNTKKFDRYWKEILPDLWSAYSGICAYSCHWFPALGGESVDHFIPKSKKPHLAYEWSNYRLSTQKLNNRKADSTDIVDPFNISGDWFNLVFPAMLVKPKSDLTDAVKHKVQNTIRILKLNEEAMVNLRLIYILEYCDSDITLKGLQKKAPFIARELIRQNLTETIRGMMKRRSV